MGVCNCSMFCCTLLYVHSSIAIILMGKRELVALLNLSSWCLLMIQWLFLAVQWGCLWFVIVVFPDHTHLLFLVAVNFIFIFIFRIQVRNPKLECNFYHSEVRTSRSPLKSMYSKRFQFLQLKLYITVGLLRCGRRLDSYPGMKGSLEGLDILHVCNRRW